jgi:hypothetical protein
MSCVTCGNRLDRLCTALVQISQLDDDNLFYGMQHLLHVRRNSGTRSADDVPVVIVDSAEMELLRTHYVNGATERLQATKTSWQRRLAHVQHADCDVYMAVHSNMERVELALNNTTRFSTGEHWSLLCVRVRANHVSAHHYDSMVDMNKTAMMMTLHLFETYMLQRPIDDVFGQMYTPQQQDGVSCGLYVLLVMNTLIRGVGSVAIAPDAGVRHSSLISQYLLNILQRRPHVCVCTSTS